MKIKNIFLGNLLFILGACSSQISLTKVAPQKNITIGTDVEQKKEILQIVEPYKQKLDKSMKEKISYTPVELNRRGDNSNIGILLSDFVLEKANEWTAKNGEKPVNAAILNIGGIRNDIGKGDILIKNIFEVMPFENELVIVQMKGEDIQGIFEYYERYQRNNPVAGLYIEIGNGKLIKGLIAGKEPKSEELYNIATSDYLAQGGDYMSFFGKGKIIKTGIPLRDLFIEKFKQNPEVRVKDEVRLKYVK